MYTHTHTHSHSALNQGCGLLYKGKFADHKRIKPKRKHTQIFREGRVYKEKSDLKIIYREEKKKWGQSFKRSCDFSGVYMEKFLVEVRAAKTRL